MSEGERKLAEISKQIDNGVVPEMITARAFISWFGAQRRTYWNVFVIREALEKYRIKTAPDFEAVWIDSSISFERAQAASEKGEAQVQEGATPSSEPTYRIGKLKAANLPPVSVKPEDQVEQAITTMLSAHRQLVPVMTNEREVRGVVSWSSIAKRLWFETRREQVKDCMEKPKEVPADTPLFDVIDTIIANGYVLVRNSQNVISGMVTTSDLSDQFRQLGEPYLLIGEIENYLRRLTKGKFTSNALREACAGGENGRVIASVADLTFGELVRLLENRDNWTKLGLRVNRAIFVAQLEKVRIIRNNVMHFDPDGIEETDLDVLRKLARFLQGLREIGAI